ncbi:MAG: metalloregulator ArsR/SmtB family transcription factor [Treponemataceae bacterium]|nr:metalloregulator ArsR/SmtB family transcription factor [Treponemataceae bacterium]
MTEREITRICKALSDENRVKIIHFLTNSELCACKLLEEFNIGQSTLSHHMKILTDCDLVNFRKDGKWVYYSINCQKFSEFKTFIEDISSKKNYLSSSNCECNSR